MSDDISENQIPTSEYLIAEIKKMKEELKNIKEESFSNNKSKTVAKMLKKASGKKVAVKKKGTKTVKKTPAKKVAVKKKGTKTVKKSKPTRKRS